MSVYNEIFWREEKKNKKHGNDRTPVVSPKPRDSRNKHKTTRSENKEIFEPGKTYTNRV